MNKPLVIGHRGACGYRPENTVESFQLAISQGADGIEFDVVTTSDEALIIRHENSLAGTTNVAKKAQFSSLRRQGLRDGGSISDWFSEDFTLAEIQSLRAVERVPDIRLGSAKFDEQFHIPQLAEVLAGEYLNDKLIVAEIKDGSHLNTLSQPISRLFADELSKADLKGHLVVESFNRDILLVTKAELEARHIAARYFYLLEHGDAQSTEKLAGSFDGLSISLEMLFANPSWVTKVHELGKQIWVYTARAERAENSVEEYYLKIIQTGVDGIFADQPDLLRRVLLDSSGSAYDY